jgi:hypothetical protein
LAVGLHGFARGDMSVVFLDLLIGAFLTCRKETPVVPIIALSAHNEAERAWKHRSGFDADVEKLIRKLTLSRQASACGRYSQTVSRVSG